MEDPGKVVAPTVGVAVAFGGGRKPSTRFTFSLTPLPQDALDVRLEQQEQDTAFKQENPDVL